VSRQVRYNFGLPQKTPERRWMENDTLPISHSQWESNGIRYTQTVLLSRLEGGDLSLATAAPDSVLLVQIKGENITNEYREASAAFAVYSGASPTTLELREGFAYAIGTGLPVLLGAIDIAGEGIAI